LQNASHFLPNVPCEVDAETALKIGYDLAMKRFTRLRSSTLGTVMVWRIFEQLSLATLLCLMIAQKARRAK